MKVGFDFIWDSGFVLYFKKKITRPIWIFVFHFFHKWNDKYGLEILLVLLLLLFFSPFSWAFFHIWRFECVYRSVLLLFL